MSQRTLLKYLILLIIVCAAAAYNIIHVSQTKEDQGSIEQSEELSSLVNLGEETTSSSASDETAISIQRQAQLVRKSSQEGNGAITVSLNEGFYSSHVALVTKDPGTGVFYEAWLKKPKPKIEWYSLGELNKKDESFEINHVSELDRSDYPEIVITQELQRDGLDGFPGKVLFAGTFQSGE